MFVGVIVVAFAFELLRVTPDPSVMADQLFSPKFEGEALLIAVGIVGATVMPHVIYLHSALTQNRIRSESEGVLKRIQRFERIDVLIAMTIAGLVNLSMLAIFASRFYGSDANSLEDAYHGLYSDPGKWAAYLLGIALLASGLSSSSVGTLAGQVVMQGFIRRQIPVFLRRAITAAPALAVAIAGVDPTRALVLSQVVLSFGIPFALVPLVLFTSRRSVMGGLVNNRLTTITAWGIAVLISGLNVSAGPDVPLIDAWPGPSYRIHLRRAPGTHGVPSAVVVGSGPNGLAGALTLARAGYAVEVHEAAPAHGGGVRTEELTLPGFRHDVCSAIHPLGRASPFFQFADLGLDWVSPPAAVAHPLDDGTAVAARLRPARGRPRGRHGRVPPARRATRQLLEGGGTARARAVPAAAARAARAAPPRSRRPRRAR